MTNAQKNFCFLWYADVQTREAIFAAIGSHYGITRNEVQDTDLGHWALENGLAVYRDIYGKTVRYDQPALELAIENVESKRSSYSTYEAYRRARFHFERGLALFKGATGPSAPPPGAPHGTR